MVENQEVIVGGVCLVVGQMLSPIANEIWRRFKGTQFQTVSYCVAKHKKEADDCGNCRNGIDTNMVLYRSEGEKTRKLMIAIAGKMGASVDDLKDYL